MQKFNGWTKTCFVSSVMCLGLTVAGCSKEESNPPDETVPGSTVKVDVYHLRGRLVSLPDAGNPASELKIHHEAIDDFKMGDGEAAPMNSMTMPFTPGEDVSFDDLAVGDAVEFTFEMQWEPATEMRAVDFKKLPADTQLSFENKDDEAGDDQHMHGGH